MRRRPASCARCATPSPPSSTSARLSAAWRSRTWCCTAGDTLLTVSLAASLFFTISPEAAQGKVILYLLLTMAPFAVVAPFLGPIIDRSRGARRATVVVSTRLPGGHLPRHGRTT